MLWRPTKAKRYFRAHQLFKWSIEVMRIFLWSLLPQTRKMKQAYKISGFTTLQKSYSEALPYEIPHQVRQHAFEYSDSPKQWSSHFSYDFWVLFTENFHVKKDKIFCSHYCFFAFIPLLAGWYSSQWCRDRHAGAAYSTVYLCRRSVITALNVPALKYQLSSQILSPVFHPKQHCLQLGWRKLQ